MKWDFVPCSAVMLSVVCCSPVFAQSNNKIYGLENALHFTAQSHKDMYIQAASFANQSNAYNYQRILQSQTRHPVKLVKQNSNYTVLIGPMNSASEIRQTAAKLLHKQPQQVAAIKSGASPLYSKQASKVQVKILEKDLPITNAHWFIGAGAGVGSTINKSNIYLANGSDFPPPYDKDTYSTSKASPGLVSVNIGRQWTRGTGWIPAYSLGLLYQHHFNADVGGQVMQYSSPQFTNYYYNWDLSSDSLLASFKLNLYSQSRLSPYINVGLGGSRNHAKYNETALPGVTPRISPDFSGTKSSFAYNAGAGVDFKLSEDLFINLGYLYQNLGDTAYTGSGSWSGSSLDFGDYELNEAVVGISYLFGK